MASLRVLLLLLSWAACTLGACVPLPPVSPAGVEALVQRRLPQHKNAFAFALVNASQTTDQFNGTDVYTVSRQANGKILVEGNTVSALLMGLHRYLSDIAHVDIWWFIGSRLHAAPQTLPSLEKPLHGSSIVPYRYHFNTVTTSYTSAFWSWEDWELQLDWMALRGINMPLAWIGVEKIFAEVFRDIGFSDDEIHSFLSGPAFLAWNHFGNIQGSWDGDLPFSWVDSQFALQRQIVRRMVELGMVPILPAFPGFVPSSIGRLYPDANVSNGSAWERFETQYTNVTFLDPFDSLFHDLQTRFITKQKEAYGNVSSWYALDQFNENDPASGDLDYLRSVTANTWQSLKTADPAARWVMQGWLFTSSADFWTNERIEAYLSGVTVDSDLLILDLFSESQPQWQRTNSYYGKPWVWCQLHDYGQNMGLYGQIENITANAVAALANSSSLVGFGLAMEGQEGNEIVYDLLLDQAWSAAPIDTAAYFADWVSARYEGSPQQLPPSLYTAWEIVRPTVYNNTNLTSNAVPKAVFELVPSTTGLVNRTGHHPTTLNYDPAVLVDAWRLLYRAGQDEPSLLAHPAYAYDLVDWTRQVLANAFIPAYEALVAAYVAAADASELQKRGDRLIALLNTTDAVLQTNANFRLSTWIAAARATTQNSTIADFLEHEARNQVTLWGPTGEISDYASKSWAGLVSGYYVPRWQMFIDYLVATPAANYTQATFKEQLLAWEVDWVDQVQGGVDATSWPGLKETVSTAVQQWSDVF